MRPARFGWYVQRLRRMSPGEVADRVKDQAHRLAWRRQQVELGAVPPPVPVLSTLGRPAPLPVTARSAVPDEVVQALLDAADRLLGGDYEILGVRREDMAAPDWFLDPTSGRRAPQERYSFSIDHRSEAQTGNVKQVWEVSRHHHLTLLAAAWFVSGEDRYADVVARQLTDWWRQNPFLSGVHWTSGIEIGIRLISWAWIRRLLDGWSGCHDLFEENEAAVHQLYWHQHYLRTFKSTGTSANNHVVAEAAGRLVASCAFPWFTQSERWGREAAVLLEDELDRNTFPSGLNRELASDYHCLVAELGLVAAVEADAAGRPLSPDTWLLLGRMLDAAAAVVDEHTGPPRQGDGDDGRALLVDAPTENHWPSLLAAGEGMFGALSWWPGGSRVDLRSVLLASLAGDHRGHGGRPGSRPLHHADAGFTLLRSTALDQPEIWCRCDAGPHGFLAIAAHAHADALSIEVRHDGVDVLADPGTYCYHGEPEWREYFRSTRAHNTIELGGQDQSRSGGPFLWTRHAESRLLHVAVDEAVDVQEWSAQHDGYEGLDPPAHHRRTVRLLQGERRLEVTDVVRSAGGHPVRLSFHCGPAVDVELEGSVAALSWIKDGRRCDATLRLPERLRWSLQEGASAPVGGWYSPSFGRREPAATLSGSGGLPPGETILLSELQFST